MKQKGFTLSELLWLIVILVGGFGWLYNIVKIVAAIADPLSLLLFLRVIGIFFPPLGAILGYF
jgi:hypothetical protein